MEPHFGFTDTEVLPLSAMIERTMETYVYQLMWMPLGDWNLDEDIVDAFEYVPIFKPQSGIARDMNISDMQPANGTQNIWFRDASPGYCSHTETHLDSTRYLQDKNDVPLDKFFSRPVKVFESDWETGTVLNTTFNPWREYFRNPRVQNRISNYHLMRCNLKMKVVLNGNGFFYGRSIVAYWPMSGYDEFSVHSAVFPADLTQTSQLPHIFLDPTTSTGGEMTIPFFWHRNYFSVDDADWGNLGGNRPPAPDAGRVLLRSLNTLKHANGADERVTISFFVWAEDMQLSVPTSTDINTLTPQAGKEIDEANLKGMISGPATTLSKMASLAAAIPPLAPYAMATSKVADAVASTAKSLGYSRPGNTVNPDPYRPTPISQLATTTTPDTSLKLTVDDKQELTIDPRISGVGSTDPMIIKEIAKRESFLTKFDWTVSATPQQLLWNARVNPVLWAQDQDAIVLPACAVAAMPFNFWTGAMKFRFQIVCSSFHKGRLEFRYDPVCFAAGTADDYNVNYIEVIDIADTQDFTMEVGNAQTRTLLRHLIPGINSVTEGYSTADYTSPSQIGNGILQVRVLNELTAPNSVTNNDIQINVFVSMGDDFEVFVPNDDFQKYVYFQPQSGVEHDPDIQHTSEPSAPEQTESENIGGDVVMSADINKVFTGESIVSFRPLLKRYNLWRREINLRNGLGGKSRIYRQFSAFPFWRKGNGQSAIEGSGTGPYNYANTVLMHWITSCFAGYRGSIRYKWLYTKPGSCCYTGDIEDNGSRVYVERKDPDFFAPPYAYDEDDTVVNTNPISVSARAIIGDVFKVPTGARGTAFATDLINPNVEFEVPYQVEERFVPGKRLDYTNDPNQYINSYSVTYEGTTTRLQEVDMHVAAGEDFQVYFWSGMPRIYYEATAPATT